MLRTKISGLQLGLLITVLVIALPIMGLFIASTIEQYHIARESLANETDQLTQIASNEQNQLLENARGILITISEQFVNNDFSAAECNHLLNDLLQRFPQFANLTVVNSNGEILCSAQPDFNLSDSDNFSWFQQAVQSQEFMVGDYQYDSSNGRSVLAVAYPVLNAQKQIQTFVIGFLDLEWVNQLASQANLPENATITLIDNQGTIFARYPNPQKFIGKTYHHTGMWQLANQVHRGNAETIGVDGIQRFYNFELLPYSKNAFIFVGIPSASVLQPITKRLVRNLIGLGIISFVSLFIALHAGNRMLIRRIENVAAAAQKLAAGDLTSRANLPPDTSDVYHLARSFNDMAEQLQKQQIENETNLSALQRSEERLRRITENAQDLIYRYDLLPEPHFSFVNSACLAITGYSPQDLYNIPQLGFKLMHPDDRILLKDLTNPNTASDQPLVLRWQRKDGQTIWAEQRIVRLYNDMGEIIAVEGIARDITKRMQTEEALTQKIEELQQFQQLTVGRELRMIELKKEINALLKLAGKPKKYQGYD